MLELFWNIKNCHKLLHSFKCQCYFSPDAAENLSDVFLLTVVFSKITELGCVTRLNACLIFLSLDMLLRYLGLACVDAISQPFHHGPSPGLPFPGCQPPPHMCLQLLQFFPLGSCDLLIKKQNNLLSNSCICFKILTYDLI